MIAEAPQRITPADLSIPPRPQVMLVLMEEMAREEPDLKRIQQAIQADPGLAGAMLKAVNSPAFGLVRKATSIAQAISLLGLRNINAIVSGLAVRQALQSGKDAGMERFWDTAEKVALIGAELAHRLRGIPPDEAYTLGLIHDCGIPLLMQRFPAYRETLACANRGEGDGFSQIEERDIGTHHGAVGYFIARSWRLPDALCQAILWHHDQEVFDETRQISDAIRNFVGVVHLAQHIHHIRTRSVVDVEWERFSAPILAHFALNEEDYLNLVDAVQDKLAEL